MKRAILLCVLPLLLAGCVAELFAGFSTLIGAVGVGQRAIDHRIQREKNERLKGLEGQLKIQNERVFKLCEQVRRQGTSLDEEC